MIKKLILIIALCCANFTVHGMGLNDLFRGFTIRMGNSTNCPENRQQVDGDNPPAEEEGNKESQAAAPSPEGLSQEVLAANQALMQQMQALEQANQALMQQMQAQAQRMRELEQANQAQAQRMRELEQANDDRLWREQQEREALGRQEIGRHLDTYYEALLAGTPIPPRPVAIDQVVNRSIEMNRALRYQQNERHHLNQALIAQEQRRVAQLGDGHNPRPLRELLDEQKLILLEKLEWLNSDETLTPNIRMNLSQLICHEIEELRKRYNLTGKILTDEEIERSVALDEEACFNLEALKYRPEVL
jgi:hypothetical protein